MTIAYTIIDRIQESEDTVSLYLRTSEGKPLEPFFPGQFLTVVIGNITRNYTLSDSPEKPHYRITIKRKNAGEGSNAMHGLKKGDIIIASKTPKGAFYLSPENKKPLVLLSAGVGITPMISILNHLIAQRDQREIWFIHSAKNGETEIMGSYLRRIQHEYDHIRMKFFFTGSSRDTKDASVLRVRPEYLDDQIRSNRFSYFICGPVGFIKTFRDHLRSNGVPEDDVKFELFTTTTDDKPALKTQHEIPAVNYQVSGLHVNWDNEARTLLEFSEKNGIFIPFACRSGTCLSCETKITSGTVRYVQEPFVTIKEHHILPCCVIPETNIAIEV